MTEISYNTWMVAFKAAHAQYKDAQIYKNSAVHLLGSNEDIIDDEGKTVSAVAYVRAWNIYDENDSLLRIVAANEDELRAELTNESTKTGYLGDMTLDDVECVLKQARKIGFKEGVFALNLNEKSIESESDLIETIADFEISKFSDGLDSKYIYVYED